jgi:hypothetical protein
MIGMHHLQYPDFLLVDVQVWRTFCPGWPLTTILPISTSQVAKITGLSHHGKLYFSFMSI